MAQIESYADIPEVNAYVKRHGAQFRSASKAVVEEKVGEYFREVAKIKFSRDGTVKATPGYEPDEAEGERIAFAIRNGQWPVWRMATEADEPPDAVKRALAENPDDVFAYRDVTGKRIYMYQVRYMTKKGKRSYHAWTIYEDNVWRPWEPDTEHLPLYGLETLKDNSVAIIHEGAKAARAMQRMIAQKTAKDKRLFENHPWAQELSFAAHVAFTAGAFAAKDTEWEMLRRNGIESVIIIPDNDEAGRSAVRDISKAVGLPAKWVQFDSRFPSSFDMADPMPEALFVEADGKKHWKGPTFGELITPCTWATRLIPNPDKPEKMIATLNRAFQREWFYVGQTGLFAWRHDPRIRYNETSFNANMRRCSDVKDTAALVLQGLTDSIDKLTYRPDLRSQNGDRRVNEGIGETALNTYSPTNVKAIPGDVTMWHEFLAHLIPDESERKLVERWIATVVARPATRMRYAMLLTSAMQGTGKTTLCEAVLRPLVGKQNYNAVTEDTIMNPQFNDWFVEKTLVVVNEFYQNKTNRAGNKLKSVISDDIAMVNTKYLVPYAIRNHAHLIACSNTAVAVGIEDSDRRWLIPTCTEEAWKWSDKFYRWLHSGGLEAIKHWADTYGDYVTTGERAPDTKAKRMIVEESRTPRCQEAYNLWRALEEQGAERSISQRRLNNWLRGFDAGYAKDKDVDYRKAILEAGGSILDERMSIDGRPQYVMVTSALKAKMQQLDNELRRKLVRESLLCDEDMANPTI
jgi:hypothetical protein